MDTNAHVDEVRLEAEEETAEDPAVAQATQADWDEARARRLQEEAADALEGGLRQLLEQISERAEAERARRPIFTLIDERDRAVRALAEQIQAGEAVDPLATAQYVASYALCEQVDVLNQILMRLERVLEGLALLLRLAADALPDEPAGEPVPSSELPF